MRERRQNRLTDLWRDLAALFLEQVSDRSSIMTVTRVELLREGKLARCYVSVFPLEREEAAIHFLTRKSAELREFAAAHTKMRSVPQFEFVADLGEKNRQRIDELLKK